MTEFFEGQDVEVLLGAYIGPAGWRKAKIVKLAGAADLPDCGGVNWYEVRFPGNVHVRVVFDAGHIRAVRYSTGLKDMADALTRQRTPCNTWDD